MFVIIAIIDIIVLFEITIIMLIEVFKRYALILIFLITFGWTNVLQLLERLMILVISSVRPCERDGWLTSRRSILLM
jgi:hypothetical protein